MLTELWISIGGYFLGMYLYLSSEKIHREMDRKNWKEFGWKITKLLFASSLVLTGLVQIARS